MQLLRLKFKNTAGTGSEFEPFNFQQLSQLVLQAEAQQLRQPD